MVQQSGREEAGRRCYALCVGIGTYSNLSNRNLRYAVADAMVIADRLADPQRGDFAVTVLNEPMQATKAALDEAVTQMLSAPGRRPDDLALLYFSCHGDIDPIDHTFCLLPSNASLQMDGQYDPTTLLGIADFARWFAHATVHNIVILLDVCHSGGAGKAIQHFEVPLDAGPNIFFIGGARVDQAARQSSQLQHGLFTHCLLRAFEQPPTSDGWLTMSQIHTFISGELPWFTKEHPTQIQSWSVSVNPNLPLVRNPGYPELAPLPPVWNVPWPRNVFFTGQEYLLSQLASMLRKTQKTALTHPHALSGLGGIGKTQLALEYAYQHRQDYHAVLWGRADTSEALISTFVDIAHVLNLPQKDEADQTVIVEAVRTWLMNRPQWLFILDNADDVALVQEFLPPAFRGHLLLTTRAQTMGKVVGSKLEVEAMPPETGALLLLRRARMVPAEASLTDAPEEDVTWAKGLAEVLGGLPLALDQAGAYIEATGCSLADYQQQYQTRHMELLALRNGPMALQVALKDDHPEPVTTTWSLSFEKVEQASPLAAELLRICAFLAPDVIPEELLVEALKTPLLTSDERASEDEGEVGFSQLPSELRQPKRPSSTKQIQEAIAVLRAYSLLQRKRGEQMVGIHRLAQAVIRDALEQTGAVSVHRLVQSVLRNTISDSEQQLWVKRVVKAINALFSPVVEQAEERNNQLLLPHALLASRFIENKKIVLLEGFNLLNNTGYYLLERARYTEAEQILDQAQIMIEQSLGVEHPSFAKSLNHLAELYLVQGKYLEAEQYYQRALHIRENVFGPLHADLVKNLNDLARLYTNQGKLEKAYPLCQRAVAICEKILGPEHPDTAASFNHLADVYRRQGEYEKAESLYQQALNINEKNGGPEHLDTATSLNHLASLYVEQGMYHKAEPFYNRALKIRKESLGSEHPYTATSLNNLAGVYQEQERYEEASMLYQQAIAIYKKTVGSEHPYTATSLNNLAEIYQQQERYEEADLLYQQAIAIYEKTVGSEHPSTAASLHRLAKLYRTQGKYEEADLLYQQAIAIYEKTLGPKHLYVAISLHGWARLKSLQKMEKEAKSLYQQAIAIYEKRLGSDHPDTLMALEDYNLLQTMNEPEE